MDYSLQTGPGDMRSALIASEARTAMAKEWLL
jgi:hypothetical protein